jgi:hypothetical protein
MKGDLMFLAPIAADRTADNPAGIDKQFLNGNGLIDGVVIQVGLLGNY